MDWGNLLYDFEKTYSFIDRLTFSNTIGKKTVFCHPLIKIYTAIAIGTMKRNLPNSVIILPRKSDTSFWVSVLLSLCTYCDNSKPILLEEVDFSVGQPLNVNNCHVEFMGKDIKSKTISLKCRDVIQHTIPYEKVYKLYPIKQRKSLSSSAELSKSCTSDYIRNPLNHMLNISINLPLQNCSQLILVSKIGDTKTGIVEKHINSTRIADLIRCGKIKADGSIEVLDDAAVSPDLLITNDLYKLALSIESANSLPSIIVIDGLDYCLDHLQILDDYILDRNIPIVVLTDLHEVENLHHLENRNFQVWDSTQQEVLSTRLNPSLGRLDTFYVLNKTAEHLLNMSVSGLQCKFAIPTRAFELIQRTRKLINSNTMEDFDILEKLTFFIIQLSRVLRVPDETWVETYKTELEKVDQELKNQKMWFSEEAFENISEIIKLLKDLDPNKFLKRGHKIKVLEELIDGSQFEDGIAIVVRRQDEVELCRQYWSVFLSERKITNVSFYTVSELLDEENLNYPPSKIIVSGWLGKEQMSKIIHSCFAPEVVVLLYPYEENWFNNAIRIWLKKFQFNQIVQNSVDGEMELKDPQEIEFSLKQISYQKYRSHSHAENIKAKMVSFTNGGFAFFSESNRILVVTDLLEEESRLLEIPRKKVNQLKKLDYVLFRESDSDIIREMADNILRNAGLLYKRDIASSWQKSLRRYYENNGNNLVNLYERLMREGCKRHIVTIKNWIFNDNIIGPNDYSDLNIIARTTGDRVLGENVDEVVEAIKTIRSSHLQAASHLRKKMLSQLMDKIPQKNISANPGAMRLDLEEHGQMTIVVVKEISDQWMDINPGWVNKLINQEVALWQG
jgi:hypothetical protein